MKTLSEIYSSEIIPDSTDKHRGDRSHLELYEQLFASYRMRASKVFEIGVRRGGSIRLWRSYFPNATIYGLDVDPKCVKKIAIDRVVGVQLDQSDKKQLEMFGTTHGPFDIGIDDGSHVWSHQIMTFETLWKYICSGGVFVVEDILPSYPTWLRNSDSEKLKSYARGSVNTVAYFKNLIDEINLNGGEFKNLVKLTELQRTIDWIAFRHNSIFIRKRDDA